MGATRPDAAVGAAAAPATPRLARDACPICRSAGSAPYLTVRRRGEDWRLARCGCGFVYCADPRADTMDPVTPGPIKPRHRQIARLLEASLPEGARVVEIGAGNGSLARLLRGRFRYEGYEPGGANPELGIRAAYFEPSGAVDAVVLDNVIEHVHDPVGLLGLAAEGLVSGGRLVVIVPNRKDLRRLHPGWRRRRHWIPPDHINYFSRADLARAFERVGVELRPFGVDALALPGDLRYLPRALAERVGLPLFGHNVVGVKR